MTHSIAARPRRSILYMPASNARALEKAKTLSADGFIFDLEDAVAPSAKAAARSAAVAAAQSKGYAPREVFIRVNALDTPWGADDIAAAAASNADGVVLPKVAVPDDIRKAAALLDKHGAPASLAIWAMMETPRAILGAADIAAVGSRLAGFMVGTADLSKDLHCTHPADRAPMVHALQQCVLAARAFGISALDGVHIDIDDDDGFDLACRQGRTFGFDGKTLVHPKQIAVANAVFSPAADDLDRARRIVAAHAEAVARNEGVTLLDGRLVEVLHVAEAHRLLAQAEAIAALERAADV